MNICAIIPTYNNARTIAGIVRRTHLCLPDIIVVNDGSTDETTAILAQIEFPVHVVAYPHNRGKGYALKQGFAEARRLGYTHALTIDSDGQHYPEDIPVLLHALSLHPDALIVGSRQMTDANMPGQNKFANKFSNFWFRLQTQINLPDTQTGMRIYPLNRLRGLSLLTSRYEAELELLVFSAWANIPLIPVPVRVYYPPREQRVSHFRPAYDFTRISILNTLLCLLAVVYGYPRMYWRNIYCFGGWGLIMLLVVQPALLLLHIFSRLFLSRTAQYALQKKYRNTLSRFARWSLNHIPGLHWTIQNDYRHQFGEKPVVYVCNHQSFLDIMIAIALHPDICIFAKNWVLHNPVLGVAARMLDTLSVSDEDTDMLRRAKALTDRGYSLLVFPEGTRSKTGDIGRFHRGAAFIAEQLHLDLCPLLLRGMGDVLPKRNFRLRPGSVTLTVLPVIKPDDHSFGIGFRRQTKSLELYYTHMLPVDIQSSRPQCVILGAGVGGLFTAALLAEKGYRPIVLEQLPVYGGGLYSYDRIGEHWQTGCHFLCGMQPDEAIGELLQRWGIDIPYEQTTFDHSPAPLIGKHEWEYFQPGAYRLIGGSQRLADSLAEYITRRSGRILLSQRVEHIDCNNRGLATAVRTQDSTYPCDIVVSSLHPKQLLRIMSDSGTPLFRSVTTRRILNTPETVGSFKVYIKLRPGTLPYDRVTHTLTRPNGAPMIVLTPPAQPNQQYARTIECITTMPYTDLAPWHQNRQEDYAAYEAFKNRLATRIIGEMEEIYPNLHEYIADFFTSTSLTYRDDYLTPEGAVFGLSMPVGGVATHIPNIFLTGQNCFLHGIYGTVQTAIQTVNAICNASSK